MPVPVNQRVCIYIYLLDSITRLSLKLLYVYLKTPSNCIPKSKVHGKKSKIQKFMNVGWHYDYLLLHKVIAIIGRLAFLAALQMCRQATV